MLISFILAFAINVMSAPPFQLQQTTYEQQYTPYPTRAALQQQDRIPTYADVEPIFQERCIICHNGPGAPKKLQLTSYDLVMKGSENGAVVKPGNLEESELIKRLRGIRLPRMPLTGPPWLSEKEIQLFEKWIAAGALNTSETTTQRNAAQRRRTSFEEVLQKETITYTDVVPIFRIRCMKCHNIRGLMGQPPEGLLLNSYENILSSLDRARVIPGNPDASELIRRIRGQALPRMPFDGPPYLNDIEIKLIEKWIAQGARDDSGNPAPLPVGAKVRLHGRLTDLWQLDQLPLQLGRKVRIKKAPGVGDYVEVRGIVMKDGNIRVERIRKR